MSQAWPVPNSHVETRSSIEGNDDRIPRMFGDDLPLPSDPGGSYPANTGDRPDSRDGRDLRNNKILMYFSMFVTLLSLPGHADGLGRNSRPPNSFQQRHVSWMPTKSNEGRGSYDAGFNGRKNVVINNFSKLGVVCLPRID